MIYKLFAFTVYLLSFTFLYHKTQNNQPKMLQHYFVCIWNLYFNRHTFLVCSLVYKRQKNIQKMKTLFYTLFHGLIEKWKIILLTKLCCKWWWRKWEERWWVMKTFMKIFMSVFLYSHETLFILGVVLQSLVASFLYSLLFSLAVETKMWTKRKTTNTEQKLDLYLHPH